MPEAAIHEHSNPRPGKHNVGAHPNAVRVDPVILAEPQAPAVQRRAQTPLGTRVHAAVGLH